MSRSMGGILRRGVGSVESVSLRVGVVWEIFRWFRRPNGSPFQSRFCHGGGGREGPVRAQVGTQVRGLELAREKRERRRSETVQRLFAHGKTSMDGCLVERFGLENRHIMIPGSSNRSDDSCRHEARSVLFRGQVISIDS